MKNLLNLNGAQLLSALDQQKINGGKDPKWCYFRDNGTPCGGPNAVCCGGVCTQTNNGQC